MSERRRCAYRGCPRRVARAGALYCSASHRELASRHRRQLRAGLAQARATIRQLALALDRLARLAGEHQPRRGGTRDGVGKRAITDAARWAAEGKAELMAAQGYKDQGRRRCGRPSASERRLSVERLSGSSSASSARDRLAPLGQTGAGRLLASQRLVVDDELWRRHMAEHQLPGPH